MEQFQNDEMYSKLMRRYFSQGGPKFLKPKKGKKKEKVETKLKKEV